MRAILKVILFAGLTLSFVNCQRAKAPTSRVVIELPQAGTPGVSSFKTAELIALIDLADYDEMGSHDFTSDPGKVLKSEDWYNAKPTGFISGSSTPINCYILGVVSKTATENVNYCGVRAVSSALQKDLPFSVFAGPKYTSVSSGATLELSLDVGAEVGFVLIGLHAQSAAACENLNRESITPPQLVSRVGAVVIQAEHPIISMPLSLAGAPTYEDCVLGARNILPRTDVVPTKLSITKSSFPLSMAGSSIGSGGSTPTCYPIEVNVLNANDRSVAATEVTPVTILQSAGIINNNPPPASTLLTFASRTNCAANTSASQIFNIQTGIERVTRWIRSMTAYEQAGDPVADFFWAQSPSLPVIESPRAHVLRKQDSRKTFEILGPKTAVTGTCLLYRVFLKGNNNTFLSATAGDTVKVTIHTSGGNTPHEIHPANTDCSGAEISNGHITLNTTGKAYGEFKIKFNGTVNADQELLVEPQALTGAYDNAALGISSRHGLSTPTGYRIIGSLKSFATSGICTGPFMVATVNNNGDAVTVPAGEERRANLNFSQSSAMSFGAEMDASGACTALSSTRESAFAHGDGADVFFIRINSAVSNSLVLTDSIDTNYSELYKLVYD